MHVELIARQPAGQQHELFLSASANQRGNNVQEADHGFFKVQLPLAAGLQGGRIDE
jgi:hypothetical protein